MARSSKTSHPSSTPAGPAAPSTGVRLVRAVRQLFGAPVATRYQNAPAVARRVNVRVPAEDKCGNSAWFKAEGLCGQVVSAVAVDWTPPGKAAPVTRFVYDDDGEGTAKFIDGAGSDGMRGHREIPGATIVEGTRTAEPEPAAVADDDTDDEAEA